MFGVLFQRRDIDIPLSLLIIITEYHTVRSPSRSADLVQQYHLLRGWTSRLIAQPAECVYLLLPRFGVSSGGDMVGYLLSVCIICGIGGFLYYRGEYRVRFDIDMQRLMPGFLDPTARVGGRVRGKAIK